MWTQIKLLLEEQSDQGPHCLPVFKNRFERFARIFSRWHKQTTFSDAGFLGILTVNSFPYLSKIIKRLFHCLLLHLKYYQMRGKQCRPWSDATFCLSQYLGLFQYKPWGCLKNDLVWRPDIPYTAHKRMKIILRLWNSQYNLQSYFSHPMWQFLNSVLSRN